MLSRHLPRRRSPPGAGSQDQPTNRIIGSRHSELITPVPKAQKRCRRASGQKEIALDAGDGRVAAGRSAGSNCRSHSATNGVSMTLAMRDRFPPPAIADNASCQELRFGPTPHRRHSLYRSGFLSAIQDLIPRFETCQGSCGSWALLPAVRGQFTAGGR
jgi:hypothetical protein